MRLRDILTALVAEARTGHWDGYGQTWRHRADECPTCAAAASAESVLKIKFLDFVCGDRVEVTSGVVGVVEGVAMAVDVKIGYRTAGGGVSAELYAPVGRFDATTLTRLSEDG